MSRGMIFGAVGAVIGFVAGGFTPQGAYYGYVAGSAIGALTAPTQRIEGPRIETTPITGAAEGDPIPTVIVNGRVGGAIAWCSPKRPVPHTTEQSKGGGVESTTYTSEWDMLIIVAGHRAAGVRRIWRLGTVVWSMADGADAQTLADSAATDKWRRMTVYTGGPDQMPDPVYEAFHGAGNVSAHRNVTSVFIEGYQSDFGGQYIPLSFEVVEDGVYGGGSSTFGAFPGPSLYYYVGPIFADASGVTIHQTNSVTGIVSVQRISADGQTVTTLNTYTLPGIYPIPPLNVSSDESVNIIYYFTGFPTLFMYNVAGLKFEFRPTYGSVRRLAKRGSVLWGSCNNGSASVIDRFVVAFGNVSYASPTVTTGALGYVPISLCADASYLYCLGAGRTAIDLFNQTTLASAGSITLPVTSSAYSKSLLMTNESGELFFANSAAPSGTSGGVLYKYNGSSWDVVSPALDDCTPFSQADGSPIEDRSAIYGDVVYHAVGPPSLDPDGVVVYTMNTTLAVQQATLSAVVTRLTEATGLLTANDIDVTDVEDIMVRGMVITQPTTTRAVLDKLLDAYLVESYEDDRIVYRKRGGDPVVTIPYRDLGASEGGEFPEPLPLGLRNDIEVPARIRGKFGNVYDDFQPGLTADGDRLTTDSLETRIVDLGLMLTPLEAARVIDVKTAELTVERRSLGPIVVTRKYAALKPTNVALVENHDGSTYRARIGKITDSGLLRTLELRPDDASTINSAAEADETDYSQTIVRNNVVTEIEALDTPAFRDADLGPGHYERIGAVGRWDGARFQVSQNDAEWSDVELVNQRATYGVAASALQDFDGGNVFDERSSLTVTVSYGEFTSTTAAELIASRTRNLIVVGAQGREEALQFRTATPVDATTVLLTGFLRGRFGTEHAMASHQVGDHVVLMQPAGIVRVDSDISAVGATRYYRAISFGKLVSSANSETFVNGGACLRPYSAANPRVVRDASGNATLSCDRRTRATGRLFGPMGSAFPLGEATEAWLWEIYSDDTYTTVLRELSSATSEVDYSAAQQTTDFGSAQAVIHARAYQLSESIGRGYPLEIAA